jgi:tRNA nucleotidyltransferase (CCA-adding enzyme)
VLRAIRFSSRLHFSLDPVLIAAARDPSIRQSLLEKVSRERIYKECEGMMNHSQSRPALSFLLLYSCHILDSVIPVDHYLPQLVQTFLEMPPALPGTRQSELNEPRGWSEWTRVGIETVYWVNVLLYMRRHPEATERSHFTAEELTEACEGSASLKAVYWAALLLRLSALTFPEKKKEVSFISILLRDGLKMENITVRSTC